MTAREPIDLVESTHALLETLPPAIRTTPEAVYALQLAATVAATTSARDVATVGKELRATLDGLRDAAAEIPERGDRVDELLARRAARAGDG